MFQFHESAATLCANPEIDLVGVPAWIGPSQPEPVETFAAQDSRGYFEWCSYVKCQRGLLTQLPTDVREPSSELIAIGAGDPDVLEWGVNAAAKHRALGIAGASNLSLSGKRHAEPQLRTREVAGCREEQRRESVML